MSSFRGVFRDFTWILGAFFFIPRAAFEWLLPLFFLRFLFFFTFMFLKFQHCSCKYYGTSHCTIVFIDEEKKFKFKKKNLFYTS